MNQGNMLEELKRLTVTERLTIIEMALQLIREDLRQATPPSVHTEQQQQLTVAAEALLPDYVADGELTAFTDLDSEDFHAQG